MVLHFYRGFCKTTKIYTIGFYFRFFVGIYLQTGQLPLASSSQRLPLRRWPPPRPRGQPYDKQFRAGVWGDGAGGGPDGEREARGAERTRDRERLGLTSYFRLLYASTSMEREAPAAMKLMRQLLWAKHSGAGAAVGLTRAWLRRCERASPRRQATLAAAQGWQRGGRAWTGRARWRHLA
jgi:hypothetical protein